MKKMSFILYAVIGLVCVLSPGTANAQSFGPSHDKVVKIFQGSSEKTAKDAVWTTKNTFKVGVIDDGTSRDGYAMYVCEVLNDEGFRGQKVRVAVVDIVRLTRSNKWVNLGEAYCR